MNTSEQSRTDQINELGVCEGRLYNFGRSAICDRSILKRKLYNSRDKYARVIQ